MPCDRCLLGRCYVNFTAAVEQGLATTLSSIPCLLQPHGPLPTLAHPLLLTLSYPQGATFFVPTKYLNFHRVNQKMAYVYGTLALRDAARMVKMEAPFSKRTLRLLTVQVSPHLLSSQFLGLLSMCPAFFMCTQ